ncbi:MAG: GNAT family N-acetyltransferase [Lachnospiraceae bacterium]|nr:GNAT family N-acetyltransferase [Lachnospiraceae bacterium]
MDNVEFKWTDGADKAFHKFYLRTENYYSSIVGGEENRKSFIPYNISSSIQHVLIAYINGVPIACSGLKKYSEKDVEIKRVWVEPKYRGHHIATDMMKIIESKAKQQRFQRTILQTRQIMDDAVRLYEKLGYYRIDNYPPYDQLDGAICFAKDLKKNL